VIGNANNGGISYTSSPDRRILFTKNGFYLIVWQIGVYDASTTVTVTGELNAYGTHSSDRSFMYIPDTNDYTISGHYIYEVTNGSSDWLELAIAVSGGTVKLRDTTRMSITALRIKP
jgi:hypothetical protein